MVLMVKSGWFVILVMVFVINKSPPPVGALRKLRTLRIGSGGILTPMSFHWLSHNNK